MAGTSVKSSPDRDMCCSLCSPALGRALWLSQTHVAMIHPSQGFRLKTKNLHQTILSTPSPSKWPFQAGAGMHISSHWDTCGTQGRGRTRFCSPGLGKPSRTR